MASIMEGPLSKWTNVMKGWQYRWFVLDYNAGLLSYYTSKDKMMRGSRRGCVRLRGAVIGIDDEDDSTFTITVDQKTFHFQGERAAALPVCFFFFFLCVLKQCDTTFNLANTVVLLVLFFFFFTE
uniref:Oxysterol binding protein like 9 n=1 Tax=Scleropages formosus TaxID=113540 RepID=A0A8C9T438_SCLFO